MKNIKFSAHQKTIWLSIVTDLREFLQAFLSKKRGIFELPMLYCGSSGEVPFINFWVHFLLFKLIGSGYKYLNLSVISDGRFNVEVNRVRFQPHLNVYLYEMSAREFLVLVSKVSILYILGYGVK